MSRTMLIDQHWPKQKSIFVNFDLYLKHNLKLFINSVLYGIRTGCRRPDLTEAFGKLNSIFKKFNSWCKDSN